MKTEKILVVSGQVALKNSIVNWPDANHPGTHHTILRTIHNIDYNAHTIQLDGESGPVFGLKTSPLPDSVGFFSKATK